MKVTEFTFENIVGKHILVGITYLNQNDNVEEQVQFHGRIIRAGNSEGIVIIKSDNKEEYILPPDLSLIQNANEGEYKLHSTGEVVVNPDLLSTWTIYPPDGTV